MSEVPKHVRDAIYKRVMADLEPRTSVVVAKTGLAILPGGVLSMFLCGQFGLGITSFAVDFNNLVHHSVGPMACAVICGSLFALIPILLLRLMSSAMQFRVMVRRKTVVQMGWLAGMAMLLGYHGRAGNDVLYLVAWFGAAFTILKLGGIALDLINKALLTPVPDLA